MSDWYRNTDWSEEIEQDFFARLKRSRSQRDQYLVIQALTLAESHPKIALRLVDTYFSTRTEDFHDPRARIAEMRAHCAAGAFKEALDAYRAALTGESGVIYAGSPVDFALLALRYRSETHFPAALELLSAITMPNVPRLQFPFLAARALLLGETGRDPATALEDAASALGLPDDVLDEFPDLVWRLRGIVRR